ncbi:hypothetical protein J6590_037265 [Homalodisca vitripennis]|nr:hypothetical protein J6590_037265 [Homalodisca vitripennis]
MPPLPPPPSVMIACAPNHLTRSPTTKFTPDFRNQSNLQPKTDSICKDNKGGVLYCLSHDRFKCNYARSQPNLQKKLKNSPTMTDVSLTVTPGVSQTCRKKLENILTTPSIEQNSSLTSGASQTCNQKLILSTRKTEASSIPLPTTDASLPITPGVSQTCRNKLKHMRTTPLKKQNPSSTTGMSQKWIKKTNKFSVSLQMAKATEKANIQEFQLPKNPNINRFLHNENSQTSVPTIIPEFQPEPHKHFLVHTYQKKTKFKTRYFINSNLIKAPGKIKPYCIKTFAD